MFLTLDSTARKNILCAVISLFSLLLLNIPALYGEGEEEIIFCATEWDGEYYSLNVRGGMGGVESVKTTNSIFTMNIDGTGLKKIIENGSSPVYSPDGRWIFFQASEDGTMYKIFRCRPDGSGIENLTGKTEPGTSAFGYNLSRDGRKIVYTDYMNMTSRVAVMNSDGTDALVLAPFLGFHYMASLSPDNTFIAFSHTERCYRLMLFDLEARTLRDLTPEGHPESFAPQFTPDGRTIVFFCNGFTMRPLKPGERYTFDEREQIFRAASRDPDGDIYRIDTDGGNLQRLTIGNKYIRFYLSEKDEHGSTDGPALSPDGKKIAFTARVNNIPQIFVMDITGESRRQITFRDAPSGRASWSPDGAQLTFVARIGGYSQLFIVDVQGGEPKQLTNIKGAVSSVRWKP